MKLRVLPMMLGLAAAFIPSVAPAESSEPKPVVAVFDIAIDGFKLPEISIKRLTKYLGVRLMMGGLYQTVPDSQLKGAMSALKLESQKDCYDETCRVQLGLEAAANKNLNVTVWKVGQKCSIIGALYDLRAAASEDAAEVAELNCDEEGLKAGIARFATQLSGRAGKSTPQPTGVPEALPPPPQMTTSTSTGYGSGDAPPPVKEESGYLSVEGTPKGARVDISGPKSFGTGGRTATSLPVRPFQVPSGEYRVSVGMPGYDTEERTVRVYADATEIVKVDLMQSSGQIQISGKPDGAKSRLECQKGFVRDFGLPSATSPWTVTVPRGQCRLVVERDGYEKYDQTIEVAGGTSVRQFVELKRDMYASGGGSTGTAGTKWVRLPGGTFQMGSNSVTLSAFELAATEVTVAQYRQCVQAGACSAPHFDDGTCYVWNGSEWKQGVLPQSFRGDNQPIVCVDWDQASAYAKWVGGRLPTEAEWEYAARSGGRNQEYPWGNQTATCSYAIMDDGGLGCGRKSTWPVCSKPAGNTAQGICDMSGNVLEWVSDWYGSYGSGSLTNPTGPSSGSTRVFRGGSWFHAAGILRAAYRGYGGPGSRYINVGFRPARSVR